MSQLATTLTLIPATRRRPANRYKRDGRGAWTPEEVWLKIKTQTSQTTLYVNRINWDGSPHVNVKLETRVQHPTEDKTAMICVRASVPIVEKDGEPDHSFRSALAWMNDAWKTKFGKCFRVNRLFDLNGPQVYHAAADSNANVLHIVEGEVVEQNGNITICNIGHSHLDGSFGDLVLADDDMHLCGPESTLVLLFKQFERPPINVVVDPPLPEGATRIIGIDNVLYTTLSRLAKPTPVLYERQKKSDWDPQQHEYRFKGSSVWISSYRVNRFPNWMQVLASRENVTVYSFEPQKKRDRDENTTEISEGSAPPAKRLPTNLEKKTGWPGVSERARHQYLDAGGTVLPSETPTKEQYQAMVTQCRQEKNEENRTRKKVLDYLNMEAPPTTKRPLSKAMRHILHTFEARNFDVSVLQRTTFRHVVCYKETGKDPEQRLSIAMFDIGYTRKELDDHTLSQIVSELLGRRV